MHEIDQGSYFRVTNSTSVMAVKKESFQDASETVEQNQIILFLLRAYIYLDPTMLFIMNIIRALSI